MPRYFTKAQARAAAAGRRQVLAKSSRQILTEDNERLAKRDAFDVFLSHSIADAELVLGVKVILENLGLSIYVDWQTDAELDRSAVSKETAAVLRMRMRQSKSLLYVASENASTSKWMPWELGYFDGLRKGGIAVLPLLEQENSSFKGQEYLGLYPLVTKDFYPGEAREDVFVEDFSEGWTTLRDFGTGNFSFSGGYT